MTNERATIWIEEPSKHENSDLVFQGPGPIVFNPKVVSPLLLLII
jgi:hypothetical protein